jgi:tRNA A37 N6-isopentenylltransferase MiaA
MDTCKIKIINMRYLNNYSKFNEGKISQFFLKNIIRAVTFVKETVDKIKGVYIPFKFNDKELNKSIEHRVIQLMDYTVFDAIKSHISKKVREEVFSTSFSEYIKSRSGVDILELCESLLRDLKEENVEWSNDSVLREKQKEKLTSLIETVNKFKSVIKKLDDEILENQKLDKEFEELAEMFKKLDPRNSENLMRSKEDSLEVFGEVGQHLDKMTAQKDLDDILDKVSRWGIESLTNKEREDLEKYSKSESVEEFDLDFAMSKVKEKYSEMDVAEMFDQELLEWVDPDWEEEYESEYDWYMDHNNGEAQDVVIESIINWYRGEFNKKLSSDNYMELFDEIKSHYNL